jgi:ferredoxin
MDMPAANAPQELHSPAAPAAGGHEPVWVESPECTACDECTTLAPKVFVYNDQKQAIVVNPKGAKYADHGQGGGKVHRRLPAPRHAVEHERAGHRETDGARGEIQLMETAFDTESTETQSSQGNFFLLTSVFSVLSVLEEVCS